MGIIEKIFGTHSENELKRIYPIVDRIDALGPEMEALSDEELRGKTREFKKRLEDGETLDDILPEAYAVVREGATRALGMRHYRVQLRQEKVRRWCPHCRHISTPLREKASISSQSTIIWQSVMPSGWERCMSSSGLP